MNLREFLLFVGTHYDRRLSMSSPAQSALRSAGRELASYCPPGFFIRASGGQAKPTFSPWIGIFDSDETTSPQRGLYLAYLFSDSLDVVSLSLQQGIEDLTRTMGRGKARRHLTTEAAAIRDRLAPLHPKDVGTDLDLGSGGFRQSAYSAGNIYCIRYSINDLPADDVLRSDLLRMMSLYGLSVAVKRDILQTRPGVIVSPALPAPESEVLDPLRDFKPRSHDEYVSMLEGRVLVKSRRHELLLQRYAEWLGNRGFQVSNQEHPRDLVVRRAENEWLVEAKVLYAGHATNAVRAAIGQLLTYRHFLPGEPTGLVGLFSESIGEAFPLFLESIGIVSVWWEEGAWKGSERAIRDELGV